MLVAKNNQPFNICDGFPMLVSDISPVSELAKKYGCGKTKTTQIMKDTGNQFSVLKKPNEIILG